MNHQKSTKSIIQNLEELLLSSETRNNKEKLDLILAVDFTEFGASGTVFTKSSIIESLVDSNESWSYKIDEFICKSIAKNVFLATYKLSIFSKDNTLLRNSLRSSIWRNKSQSWQIIFHQGTKVEH